MCRNRIADDGCVQIKNTIIMYEGDQKSPSLLWIELKELFLGLRSPKKRSLLSVNEHFKGERNNKRAFLVNPFFL